MIRCVPDAHLRPVDAECRYVRADYTLLVGPHGDVPPAMNRLSCGSTTFLFQPPDHLLVALDSYTNSERWEQRPLTVPSPSIDAALVCQETFDENGIARGSATDPTFAYSSATRVLQITLREAVVTTWIRCMKCVVGGLDRDSQLVTLFVEGVTP